MALIDERGAVNIYDDKVLLELSTQKALVSFGTQLNFFNDALHVNDVAHPRGMISKLSTTEQLM